MSQIGRPYCAIESMLLRRCIAQPTKALGLRRLHIQVSRTLPLFQNKSIPLLPCSRASTINDVRKITSRLLDTYQHVDLQAEVILPGATSDEVTWTSGSQGIKHRCSSVEESSQMAKNWLGQNATYPHRGHSIPCNGVVITSSPKLQQHHRLLLFPSRSTLSPVLREYTVLSDPVRSPGAHSSVLYHDLVLDIRDEIPNAGKLNEWATSLGISALKMHNDITKLRNLWKEKDILRLGIDLGLDSKGQLWFHQPSLYVDPSALYRQKNLAALEDTSQKPALEVEAARAGLFYVKKFGGNIGAYGYGAGVAMSTVDALVLMGGKPANFLDGGGGATVDNVRAALSLLMSDEDVKVIFVNSFGGITKTDLIAKGLVEILRESKENGKRSTKIVARLRGTGSEEARSIIESAHDLQRQIEIHDDMQVAAEAAVKASL